MTDPVSKTTNALDEALTCYERGVLHRTLGLPRDVECLDDAEAFEYMRGYRDAGR